MDGTAAAEFIQRRKGRYMAQTLEAFEKAIAPYLDPDCDDVIPAQEVENFKALVRARLTSLANDACDVVRLGDQRLNGAAVDLRDHVSPHGR